MEIPSRLLQDAVEQFASLPGIGRKTALRLALHLLNRTDDEVQAFSAAFTEMKASVQYCETCHNIATDRLCSICSNPKRQAELVCVVEDLRDIIALENTGQFSGKYHLLGGHISPMDGVGPNDLNIKSLVERVAQGEVTEVILALSTTMEGDTTNFFLYKKLSPLNVSITTIARGVGIGDELEYTDELTLGRSITHRTPYEKTLSR